MQKKNLFSFAHGDYYYYNGLILPLYPVLCCFKRDLHTEICLQVSNINMNHSKPF